MPEIRVTSEMFAAIAVSLAVIIVFFVAALFVGRIRFGLRLIPFAFGLAVYLLVGYLLENYLLGVAMNALFSTMPDFYMLAAGLIVGLLEMGAALAVFKLTPRQTAEMGGFYSFAFGFSVLRAVMFAVLPLMESLRSCIGISAYGWEAYTASLPPETAALLNETMLYNMEYYGEVFLLPAIQVCLNCLLTMSMMLVVLLSCQKAGRSNLFAIALFFTAIANCALAMKNIGAMDAGGATALFAAACVLSAVLAFFLNKKYNMLMYPGKDALESAV